MTYPLRSGFCSAPSNDEASISSEHAPPIRNENFMFLAAPGIVPRFSSGLCRDDSAITLFALSQRTGLHRQLQALCRTNRFPRVGSGRRDSTASLIYHRV